MFGNPSSPVPPPPKQKTPRLETLIPEANVQYAREIARVKGFPVELNLSEFTTTPAFTSFYDSLLAPHRSEKLSDITKSGAGAVAEGAPADELTQARQTAAAALVTSINELKDRHTADQGNLHQEFTRKVVALKKASKEDPEVKLNEIERLRTEHIKKLADMQGRQLHEISNFYESPENKAHLQAAYTDPAIDIGKIKSEQTKAVEKLHKDRKTQLQAEYDAAREREVNTLAFIRQQAAAAHIAALNPEYAKESSMGTGNAQETILPPMEQIKTRHHNIMYHDEDGTIRQTIATGFFSSNKESDENIRDQILFALAQPGCKSITISAKSQTWGQYFKGEGETSDDKETLRRQWRIAKEIDPDLVVKGYTPDPDDEKWLREYRAYKVAQSEGVKESGLSITSTLEALDKNIQAKLQDSGVTGLPKATDKLFVPNDEGSGVSPEMVKRAILANDSIAGDISHQLHKIDRLKAMYSSENNGVLSAEHKAELSGLLTKSVNPHLALLEAHQQKLNGYKERLREGNHSEDAAKISKGENHLESLQQKRDQFTHEFHQPAAAPAPGRP